MPKIIQEVRPIAVVEPKKGKIPLHPVRKWRYDGMCTLCETTIDYCDLVDLFGPVIDLSKSHIRVVICPHCQKEITVHFSVDFGIKEAPKIGG